MDNKLLLMLKRGRKFMLYDVQRKSLEKSEEVKNFGVTYYWFIGRRRNVIDSEYVINKFLYIDCHFRNLVILKEYLK